MEPVADRTRCARCGAAVRPRAPWCTLCLASTGHPSSTDPATSDARRRPSVPGQRPPGHLDPGFDPLTAPAEALGLPSRRSASAVVPQRPSASWPCSACDHDNPLTAGVCGACGSAFLSGVRKAEGPLLALPVVGDLTRLQRGQRLGLAFGVMLAIVLVAGLVMLLLS